MSHSQSNNGPRISAQGVRGEVPPGRRTRYRMQASQAQQEGLKARGLYEVSSPPPNEAAHVGTPYENDASEWHQEMTRAKQSAPGAGSQEAQASAVQNSLGKQRSECNADDSNDLWQSRVLVSYESKQASHVRSSAAVGQNLSKQEAMINIIDRMFDQFQNAGYDFNRTAVGGDLELAWIRPFLGKEPDVNNHTVEDNHINVFSGRISTRHWTMVVRGKESMIDVFILPAEKLIGFALNHEGFKPYLQIEPWNGTAGVAWRIGQYQLNSEIFPLLYTRLFEALIRFAKGEARENEQFDLSQIGINTSIKKAAGVQLTTEITAGINTGVGTERALPQAPEGDSDEQAAARKHYQQAFLDDLKKHLSNAQPLNSAAPISASQVVPAQSSAYAGDNGSSTAKSGTTTAVVSESETQKKNVTAMNLSGALDLLISALDHELEIIAKAGAEAFSHRDLARADAALRFSGRLSEYRKMSQELLDYYRRKL